MYANLTDMQKTSVYLFIIINQQEFSVVFISSEHVESFS